MTPELLKPRPTALIYAGSREAPWLGIPRISASTGHSETIAASVPLTPNARFQDRTDRFFEAAGFDECRYFCCYVAASRWDCFTINASGTTIRLFQYFTLAAFSVPSDAEPLFLPSTVYRAPMERTTGMLRWAKAWRPRCTFSPMGWGKSSQPKRVNGPNPNVTPSNFSR